MPLRDIQMKWSEETIPEIMRAYCDGQDLFGFATEPAFILIIVPPRIWDSRPLKKKLC